MTVSELDEVASAQTDIVDWQTSLQSACFDAISTEDIKEIVSNQVAKAKQGDTNAIKFVMGHLLGGNRNVQIKQTNVITDVETAARIARDQDRK